MSISILNIGSAVLVTAIASAGLGQKAVFDSQEAIGSTEGTAMYRLTLAVQNYMVKKNLALIQNDGTKQMNGVTIQRTNAVSTSDLYKMGILDPGTPLAPRNGSYVIRIYYKDLERPLNADGTPQECPVTEVTPRCNLVARIWTTEPITQGLGPMTSPVPVHLGATLLNASKGFAGISYSGESGQDQIKFANGDGAISNTIANPVPNKAGILYASTDLSTDSGIGKYLRLSGEDTMAGQLQMGGNDITDARSISLGTVGGGSSVPDPALKVTQGGASISGATSIKGNTDITGNTSVTGDTTIGGNTSVTGNTSLTGALTASGSATLKSGLTVTSGGATIRGDLKVPDTVAVPITTADDPNGPKFLLADSNGKVVKSPSSYKQFATLTFNLQNTYLDIVDYDTRIRADKYTMIMTGFFAGVQIKVKDGMLLGPNSLKIVPVWNPTLQTKTWHIIGDTYGSDQNTDTSTQRYWQVNTLVYANDVVVDRGCVTEQFNGQGGKEYNNTRSGIDPMSDLIQSCN